LWTLRSTQPIKDYGFRFKDYLTVSMEAFKEPLFDVSVRQLVGPNDFRGTDYLYLLQPHVWGGSVAHLSQGHTDPHWQTPPGLKLEGVEFQSIIIKRNGMADPILDETDTGVKGFGGMLHSPRGDLWEFDRYGNRNPAYVQWYKAKHEKWMKLESEKSWNIDPSLDQGINFDNVVLPCSVKGKFKRQGGRVEATDFRFDAPDYGTSGPWVRSDGQLGSKDDEDRVYKFDMSGKLNPLFLQLRRSKVEWN